MDYRKKIVGRVDTGGAAPSYKNYGKRLDKLGDDQPLYEISRALKVIFDRGKTGKALPDQEEEALFFLHC